MDSPSPRTETCRAFCTFSCAWWEKSPSSSCWGRPVCSGLDLRPRLWAAGHQTETGSDSVHAVWPSGSLTQQQADLSWTSFLWNYFTFSRHQPTLCTNTDKTEVQACLQTVFVPFSSGFTCEEWCLRPSKRPKLVERCEEAAQSQNVQEELLCQQFESHFLFTKSWTLPVLLRRNWQLIEFKWNLFSASWDILLTDDQKQPKTTKTNTSGRMKPEHASSNEINASVHGCSALSILHKTKKIILIPHHPLGKAPK